MGTKAIDPQSIRNVTLIGHPDDTTPVIRRLRRCFGTTTSGAETTVHCIADSVEHTIRVVELSTHAPIAHLERSIRVADGLIAVVNAAARTSRLETVLRIADDHQVARLCLVTALDHPAADFDRAVRTIAETRGAAPLLLQSPVGLGPTFEGVTDLQPGPLPHIRYRTRLGDIVPTLCAPPPTADDIAPLLDAIARYLPSPLDVCQPEHALDY
ncbi:GTP-binding protein [Nocardia sp. NPDC050406]|uniref:GTP-binding protein n=1 Tax=Nocardia sp. NPDC050406 TaxID=3364318 RepID=UPI0037948C6D